MMHLTRYRLPLSDSYFFMLEYIDTASPEIYKFLSTIFVRKPSGAAIRFLVLLLHANILAG